MIWLSEKYMENKIEQGENLEKQMVKRQIPFTAMGGSICSYCIIEKSKNIIGLEMPDILTLPEHDEMREILEDHQADELAFACIKTIAEKIGLNDDEITFCRLSSLENQKSFGSIFVGLLIQKMKPDENMAKFRSRIIENFQKMGLIGAELDGSVNTWENEDKPLNNSTDIVLFEDIYFFYTEKEHDDDLDDYDEGNEDGFENGSTVEHFLARLAIYRCLKNRKIKEMDAFLEDFDAAMENFKADSNFLKRWTKKYKEDIEE